MRRFWESSRGQGGTPCYEYHVERELRPSGAGADGLGIRGEILGELRSAVKAGFLLRREIQAGWGPEKLQEYNGRSSSNS